MQSAHLFLAILAFFALFAVDCCLLLNESEDVCVTEVFNEIDRAFSWPSVDLVVVLNHRTALQFQLVLRSIELFWPKSIGKTLVLVDDIEEYVLRPLMASWCTVIPINRSLYAPWLSTCTSAEQCSLGNKLISEVMNFFVDEYSTADYISYLDSDNILDTKVTPDLIFDALSHRVIVKGLNWPDHPSWWRMGTDFLLGPALEKYDFMVNIPFTIPRTLLPRMRSHMVTVHSATDIREIFSALLFSGSYSIQNPNGSLAGWSTMGNFMWNFMHDDFAWSIRNSESLTENVPSLWAGKHIPYSKRYYDAVKSNAKLTDKFALICGQYMFEGLCHSLPRGKLAGCNASAGVHDSEIIEWQSGIDWRGDERAWKVAESHFTRLHAMYDSALHSVMSRGSLHQLRTRSRSSSKRHHGREGS